VRTSEECLVRTCARKSTLQAGSPSPSPRVEPRRGWLGHGPARPDRPSPAQGSDHEFLDFVISRTSTDPDQVRRAGTQRPVSAGRRRSSVVVELAPRFRRGGGGDRIHPSPRRIRRPDSLVRRAAPRALLQMWVPGVQPQKHAAAAQSLVRREIPPSPRKPVYATAQSAKTRVAMINGASSSELARAGLAQTAWHATVSA